MTEGIAPVKAGEKPVFPGNLGSAILITAVDPPGPPFTEGKDKVRFPLILSGRRIKGHRSKRIAIEPVEVPLQLTGKKDLSTLEMDGPGEEFIVKNAPCLHSY